MPRIPTIAGARLVVRHVWRHPSNRGQRARRLVRTLRFQARARVLRRPTEVPYCDHSVMLAVLDGATSKRAVYFAAPDFPEMLVWQRHLTSGSRFVDVGANAGLYTVLALDAGAQVIAVEPSRAVADQLRENLRRNRYRADVVQSAVADQAGRLGLSGLDASRASLELHGNRTAMGLTTEMVDVTTLDELIGETTIDGLKIDVEGAERLVLEGAVTALREHRVKLIQLEWNDLSIQLLGETREPVAAFLRSHGYELLRPDEHGELVAVVDLAPGADLFARPRAG